MKKNIYAFGISPEAFLLSAQNIGLIIKHVLMGEGMYFYVYPRYNVFRMLSRILNDFPLLN